MATNRVQTIEPPALPPVSESAKTLVEAALSGKGDAEGYQKILDRIAAEARTDALEALACWVVRQSEALAVRIVREARAAE